LPSTEKRRWTPRVGANGGRASRIAFDYDAFVPDAIDELDLALPSDVAAVVTEAEVAVRELNGASPHLEALETLARRLLRAEAVASSQIEGLEMSHRRLERAAFAPEDADRTARLVHGNVRAMEAAIALGASHRPLTRAGILALHAQLFRGTELDHLAGQLRTSQNWIGDSDESPRGAEFIPPSELRVPDLLDDLCRFAARMDLPAIAQAAIIHSQFETIHPFADGNGRIGRCLIHVVFRQRDLAPNYVPPVSLVLATDQQAYIRGLNTFRRYDHEGINSWIATFAQATRTAAREAMAFAGQIEALQASWRERVGIRRAGTTAEKIISILPGRPVLDVKSAAEVTGVVYESARAAIDQLQHAKILRAVSSRRRDRVFEAPNVFELVNGFERHLAHGPASPRPVRRVPRAGKRAQR
jgi:Fic family protein